MERDLNPTTKNAVTKINVSYKTETLLLLYLKHKFIVVAE